MDRAGIALNASLALYEATKDDKYRSAAISYGDYVLQCQQRDDLSERVPLKGSFYQDASRGKIPLLREYFDAREVRRDRPGRTVTSVPG
jgi:hypothetical protein